MNIANNNESSRHKPAYELYVCDGTIHNLPTRNYHGVTLQGIPPSALFCVAVHEPQDDCDEVFKRGNVIKMPNVRTKQYQGEVELGWSNMVLAEQQGQGWRDKRCTVVDPEDNRVTVINTSALAT